MNVQEQQHPTSPTLPGDGAPPELLNHSKYAIIRQLGQGGMGTVYLAKDRDLDREVALKVMTPDLLQRGDALERFKQEARSSAKLRPHPNVVQVFDLDHAGQMEIIVMEYVAGVDLGKQVREKGPLSVPVACHFLRQAALGLQHAFEHGLVHRDIKPNNLIVTQKAQLKIVDFGLAKPAKLPGKAGVTGDHAIIGTIDYMAPEQATSARDVDIRADLYSLGCTAFYLLTGRPPFVDPENNQISILVAHSKDAPPLLHQLTPDVPPELSSIVAKLLAKLPQERFQQPMELAQALLPFIKRSPEPPPAVKAVPSTSAQPDVVASNTRTVLGSDTSNPPQSGLPVRAFNSSTELEPSGPCIQQRTFKPNRRKRIIAAAIGGLCLALLAMVAWRQMGHVDSNVIAPDSRPQTKAKPDSKEASRPNSSASTPKGTPKPTDAITEKLAQTKQRYEQGEAKRAQELLLGFDTRLRATKDSAQLAALKVQKLRFERDGMLPSWATTTFIGKALTDRDLLLVAYNAAIRECERKGKVKEANDLGLDKAVFEGASAVLMVWQHSVNGGPRGTIRLFADGSIQSTEFKNVKTPVDVNSWRLTGDTLVLTWRNSRARGGYYVDTCTVSSNGKNYNGKNQDGASIAGYRTDLGE